MAHRRTPSEVSLLSAEDLYTLEGVDARRRRLTPPEAVVDSDPRSPVVSSDPSMSSEASPRSRHPSADPTPPPPKPLSPLHPPDPDVLEQLADLRARAEIAETRARYLEVTLARAAVALETERARSLQHWRTVVGIGQGERKRARPPSGTYVTCASGDEAEAASADGADAPEAARPEVVARAWNFLVTHADAPRPGAEETRAAMARIRRQYDARPKRPRPG